MARSPVTLTHEVTMPQFRISEVGLAGTQVLTRKVRTGGRPIDRGRIHEESDDDKWQID